MVQCFLAILFLTAANARADILFEGYSKILLGGEHVGYIIQRYEFDPKKKEFGSTYLMKTNAKLGNVTESLKARANDKLQPISYQSTSLMGETARTIDATAKNNKLVGTIREGNKTQSISKPLPKGSFFSTFLLYVMLLPREKKDTKTGLTKSVGIEVGNNYAYQAIAEEDASIHPGQAYVEKIETYKGHEAFRIMNKFKDQKFISYMSLKGEVMATHSPAQNLSTELVADLKQAVGSLSFSSASVTTLFGNIPEGKANPLGKAPAPAKPLPPGFNPEKAEGLNPVIPGVQPGQGIHVKSTKEKPIEPSPE